MIHNVNTRCLPLMGILLWAAIGSLPAMAGNDIGNAVQVQSITSESAGAFLRKAKSDFNKVHRVLFKTEGRS